MERATAPAVARADRDQAVGQRRGRRATGRGVGDGQTGQRRMKYAERGKHAVPAPTLGARVRTIAEDPRRALEWFRP